MAKITVFLGITLFLLSPCFAEEEEFSITTYYPSPFGSYNELEIRRSITYHPVNAFSLSAPQDGELIYNVDKKFWYYNGTERQWKALAGSPELITIWNNQYYFPQTLSNPVPSDAKYVICAGDGSGSGMNYGYFMPIEFRYKGNPWFTVYSQGGAPGYPISSTISAGGGGLLEVILKGFPNGDYVKYIVSCYYVK